MVVQVENELEYCVVRVAYQADPEIFRAKKSEIIDEVRKQAPKISGFHPVKKNIKQRVPQRAGQKIKKVVQPKNVKFEVPDSAIENKFKDYIEKSLIRDMVTLAYDDIIFETGIVAIGAPYIESSNIIGDKFECKMVFHKKPEFELSDSYKNIEVPRPHQEKDLETLVHEGLADLAKAHGSTSTYEDGDVVIPGDKISIDVKSSIFTEDGVIYEVGSERFGPEFDKNLIGMQIDKTAKFVCGEIEFEVTLHMGMRVVPHDINEELAKKCGSDSLEGLLDSLRAIINQRVENRKTSEIRNSIARRLIDEHPFEVPSFLYLKEAEMLANKYNITLDKADEDTVEKITTMAKDSCKFSLILDSIKQKEPESMLTDSEALEAVKMRAQADGTTKNLDEAFKQGLMPNILAEIKDRYAANWLVKQATLVD